MTPVAVTQRVDVIAERGERRDAADQRLTLFLADAGLLAVPVPNTLAGADGAGATDALAAWVDRVRPGGIVLSGGNDVGACPERDATEAFLIDHARAQGLPLLGICRGMQMIAHHLGGTLAPVTGHVATRHALAALGGRSVNSYHDFTVATAPPDFEVTAAADDGAIEAFRHRTLPVEGWMWHPEREAPFDAADVAATRALFVPGGSA